ncbi:hypothetical protein LCGC14_1756150, partial [marine sediment metagenome]
RLRPVRREPPRRGGGGLATTGLRDGGGCERDGSPGLSTHHHCSVALYRVMPEAVRQLFWQLLVQGLLVWGCGDISPNWPLYRATDYGESILKHEGARPYDPDGFLKEFATTNPQADSVVLDYLEGAARVLNSDCHRAAAVILGRASEQLVLVLHQAFPQAACAQNNDCLDHILPVMPVARRTVCQTSRGANPR